VEMIVRIRARIQIAQIVNPSKSSESLVKMSWYLHLCHLSSVFFVIFLTYQKKILSSIDTILWL
jgi:hypothetical protein